MFEVQMFEVQMFEVQIARLPFQTLPRASEKLLSVSGAMTPLRDSF